MKQRLINEKGSTSILIMGVIVGIILMSFVFIEMSSGFMERRVSQSEGDSAAMAAAIQAEKSYNDDLKRQCEQELDAIKSDEAAHIHPKKDNQSKDHADHASHDNPDKGKNSDSQTVDKQWKEWFKEIEAVHGGRPLPADIKSWLKGETDTIDYQSAVTFLWNDQQLSDYVCQSIDDHWNDIVNAARKYASLNGLENANDNVDVVFPVDQKFNIAVRTKKPDDAKFLNINLSDQKVPAESIAHIPQPLGKAILCH